MITPPDAAARAAALDPTRSAIVKAPAGSGKTTLLVQRYLQLLAGVRQPEEILAITFTRKAAAEMRVRVLAALSAGATDAAKAALARSDRLGWSILETPARLRIQTIDSFAMSLVRSLPSDPQLPPGITLMEAPERLYGLAVDRLFERIRGDDPIGGILARLLAAFDNDYPTLRGYFVALLGRREQWIDSVGAAISLESVDRTRLQAALEHARAALNESLVRAASSACGEALWQELRELTEAAFENLRTEDPELQCDWRLLGNTWITGTGTLRRQLNRKQGFLPKTDLKARAEEVLETLGQRDLELPLDSLRHLATSCGTAAELDVLVDVCIGLTFAAETLRSVFQERQQADFPALLIAAKRLLGRDDAPTELALILDYRLQHLLIDEFQDTSNAQFELFELLTRGWTAEEGNTFFAVGDPMQSIYRFREADISTFYRAVDPGLGSIKPDFLQLTANFRSDAGLVDWYNKAFVRLFGRVDDPLLGQVAYTEAEATRPALAACPVTFTTAADTDTAAHGIVARIVELLEQHPGETIAVLLRNRNHGRELLRVLTTAGIAWRGTDMDSLADRPVVADLLSLQRLLLRPADQLARLAVLRSPLVGLALADLESLALAPLETSAAAAGLSADGRVRLHRFIRAARRAQSLLDEVSIREVLETYWLHLGGPDAYPQPQALDDAERYFLLLDDLGVRARDLASVEDRVAALKAADTRAAPVEVLTIHKAKGLQWDHVIVPGLDLGGRSDTHPVIRWRSSAEGLLLGLKSTGGLYGWLSYEERTRSRHELDRLLYVACTRAQRSLSLFGAPLGDAGSGTLQHRLAPALPVTPQEQLNSTLPAEATPPPASALRLPADHLPAIQRLTHTGELPEPVPAAAADVIAARSEVCLGQLLHRALEHLARPGTGAAADFASLDASRFVSERRRLWEERLLADGVAPAEWDWVLNELTRQLENVLTDPEAVWIVAPQAAPPPFRRSTELPLAWKSSDPLQPAMPSRMVVDRITRDPAGQLWIIDYKSSRPGGGEAPDAFALRESARYREQLSRYGNAVAEITGEPVRLGLYFTALPRLMELEPAA